MAKKPDPKPYPRKIDQHDYVSVDLGNNRRLTVSHGGEKASGAVPASVWICWSIMCQRKERNVAPATLAKLTDAQRAFLAGLDGAAKNGERVDAFVAAIGAIWPEWDTPPRSFAVGEEVRYDFGARRGGVDTGTVTKVGRTVTVRWARSGLVSMAADLLAEHNP